MTETNKSYPERNSFIIHLDSLNVLDDMDDVSAGKLFKAIKAYQNNQDIDIDMITKIAISPFKNQFKRDEVKYSNVVERNRENGKKGGRPKYPKKPSGLSGNPNYPKKPDSDSDSDSDSKNESVSDNLLKKETKKDFKDYLFELGCEKELIKEWMLIRKKKKAVNTETAFKGFLREVNKSGQDPNEILRHCVENSWSGFKYEWIQKLNNYKNGQKSPETPIYSDDFRQRILNKLQS